MCSLYTIVVYMCKVKFISDTHLGNCLIRYNTLFNEDHSLKKTFRYKVLREINPYAVRAVCLYGSMNISVECDNIKDQNAIS